LAESVGFSLTKSEPDPLFASISASISFLVELLSVAEKFHEKNQ
jgi:hypothetical protein